MTVPTLFIGYLTKTQGVVKSLTIEDDFINIADLNEETLGAKLELLWSKRPEKRRHLANVMADVHQQLEESVELLKKDITYD